MKYLLKIRSSAEQDLLEAYRRYEAKEVGLGAEIIRCVDACIHSIENGPELRPLYYRKLRRWYIRRFPYGIFYIFEPPRISIVAILDLREDPKKLRQNLRKR